MKTPFLQSRFGSAAQMLLLSIGVGIAGGFGAIVFHWLISLFIWIFYGYEPTTDFVSSIETVAWPYRLLIPALGGFLVGLVIKYGKVAEARGHGVPEVMEAVALHHGTMRFRVAPLKTLASAITIGSGGSAGREGPIIQIGSAIGSNVGQYFKLSESKTRTLLAAGAAAGIGGTFNAPIAGVIFCWELLLRRMTLVRFFFVLLAAAVGTFLTNYVLDFSGPFIRLTSFTFTSILELPLYVGLGIAAALTALLYVYVLHGISHLFNTSHIHLILRPTIGGLLLGCVALLVPQVHEPASYSVMLNVLNYVSLPASLLLLILLAKILATGLTLGSGGSGGIFAPALFIGATLGSAYGIILTELFPALSLNPASFAVIGMAAVFAAAANAPFTAVIVLVEMTRTPEAVIPLIIACAVSTYLAKWLQPANIYSIDLKDRGIDINKVYQKLNG